MLRFKLSCACKPGIRTVARLLFGGFLALPLLAQAQTVLVTGANSGIGLEFARQYAAAGWNVIATHRRSAPPRSLVDLAAGHPNVRIEELDVTSVEQADALAKRLANAPIDVLINNAGVYNDRSGCAAEDEQCAGDWKVENFGNLAFPLYDTMLAVNVKGPLIVSEAFYANVKASRLKKIVAISSSNGSLTGEALPRPGIIFYRASKAALNREMQIVASSVKGDGVTVVMLNPGATVTEHQKNPKNYPGMLASADTVRQMIATIGQVTIKDSGRFLRYNGATEPW